MTAKIKAKLLQLADQLHKHPETLSEQEFFKAIQALYESTIVAQYLSTANNPKQEKDGLSQQNDLQKALTHLEIDAEPKPATPANEQHEEIPPLMDTIKNMVTEMPESQFIKELQEAEEESPLFVKKESHSPSLASSSPPTPSKETEDTPLKKNLNDQFAKTLKIDRNDQLAFTNQLFNKNSADFQKALQQIISMESWEEVEHFVGHILKPDYNNWEGKEFYEERFLSVLNGYFSP